MKKSYSWSKLIRQAKKEKRRKTISDNCMHVSFVNDDKVLEFDPDHCALAIRAPGLEGWDYNETPWDEEEEIDIPWWEYPDLDEDDELTAMCKKVVKPGSECDINRRADRVQSYVIQFALKLKQKRLRTLQSTNNKDLANSNNGTSMTNIEDSKQAKISNNEGVQEEKGNNNENIENLDPWLRVRETLKTESDSPQEHKGVNRNNKTEQISLYNYPNSAGPSRKTQPIRSTVAMTKADPQYTMGRRILLSEKDSSQPTLSSKGSEGEAEKQKQAYEEVDEEAAAEEPRQQVPLLSEDKIFLDKTLASNGDGVGVSQHEKAVGRIEGENTKKIEGRDLEAVDTSLPEMPESAKINDNGHKPEESVEKDNGNDELTLEAEEDNSPSIQETVRAEIENDWQKYNAGRCEEENLSHSRSKEFEGTNYESKTSKFRESGWLKQRLVVNECKREGKGNDAIDLKIVGAWFPRTEELMNGDDKDHKSVEDERNKVYLKKLDDCLSLRESTRLEIAHQQEQKKDNEEIEQVIVTVKASESHLSRKIPDIRLPSSEDTKIKIRQETISSVEEELCSKDQQTGCNSAMERYDVLKGSGTRSLNEEAIPNMAQRTGCVDHTENAKLERGDAIHLKDQQQLQQCINGRKTQLQGEMINAERRLKQQLNQVTRVESALQKLQSEEEELASHRKGIDDSIQALVVESQKFYSLDLSPLKRLQNRCADLEEKVVCMEIEYQHINFSVYAIGNETT